MNDIINAFLFIVGVMLNLLGLKMLAVAAMASPPQGSAEFIGAMVGGSLARQEAIGYMTFGFVLIIFSVVSKDLATRYG